MLDKIDIELLSMLQQDSQLTTLQLSEKLNLSASQIGRRRQRLEHDGYIIGYRAHLDPTRLGLSVQAFIQVQTTAHAPEHHESFLALANARPEVVAAWTMTGEADYMLRVFCPNLSALNRLVQEVLLPHNTVSRVQSQIVMDQFKDDAALPT